MAWFYSARWPEIGPPYTTVRLEARTDQGEVETTESIAFSRPAIVNTLAEGSVKNLGQAGA